MAEVALVIAAVVAWVYGWPLWAQLLLTGLAVAGVIAEAGADD